LAKRAVISVAGAIDDPFQVQRLEDQALASDTARLADEYAAQSMLGGRRAVWVTNAGDGLFRSLPAILDAAHDGNLIIAETSALPKSSKLRTELEGHTLAMVCPIYDPNPAELAELIDSMLEAADMSIAPDARARLVELIGADQAMSRSEISKLISYCIGASTVTLADVEAACGDTSAVSSDDLLDAVFSGDAIAADLAYWSLLAAGGDSSRLLGQASTHAGLLQGLQLEVLKGISPDQVIKSARPVIFFKRQRAMAQQLKAWDIDALASAQSSISAAQLQTRQFALLSDAIGNRTLLSLARMARALRQSAV
jgi:DNA polymerase-3 subunit delta